MKIIKIKQKRRNKMYNDNRNDIYDNDNISNKNQLDLSLFNVKSDVGVTKKKKKQLLTLGRLQSH